MLIETKAIVLHRTLYNDKHHIVHLYTENYGRLAILVPAKQSKRKDVSSSLPPLSEIDLIAERKPSRQIAYPKSIRIHRANSSIQSIPSKCSQGIFLSELLYKVLVYESPDQSLYRFVSGSLYTLNNITRGVANFYLTFCFHLLRHLAIPPTIEPPESNVLPWFDLKEASYVLQPQSPETAIPPELITPLYIFSRINYENMHLYAYNRHHRRVIMDYLLLYYRLHLPTFGAIKSLDILRGCS